MKTKDILIGLFGLLLVAGVAFVWLSPEGLARAPEVSVKTIDGRDIRLADLRGRPVLVTFWATSCPGCIKEMPHLIELYQALHPRGFELIGIAMSYDPPNHVMQMAKSRRIPYPVALDIDGAAARAFGDVRLTPSSFLIAPDGRVVHQKIGEMDMKKLRRLIEGMLPPGGGQTALRAP